MPKYGEEPVERELFDFELQIEKLHKLAITLENRVSPFSFEAVPEKTSGATPQRPTALGRSLDNLIHTFEDIIDRIQA